LATGSAGASSAFFGDEQAASNASKASGAMNLKVMMFSEN
jgi:hypothetical protein